MMEVVERSEAPAIVGMERRKEKANASDEEIPKRRLAVIVVPERDNPGRIARACERPILRLFF